MEIKKGDWFRCIEGSHPHRKSFIEGNYYKSESDGCITCENENKNHSITGDKFKSKHFAKLYTIQDLKDGKVDVVNDGTVSEIATLLKIAFPNSHECQGTFSYYCLNRSRDGWMDGITDQNITHPIRKGLPSAIA